MKPRVLITSASFGSPLSPNIVQHESSGLDIYINRIQNNKSVITTNPDALVLAETDLPSRINAMHPRLRAKMPKMLQWAETPGYDYYIWLDSKLRIENPKAAELLVEACTDHDACFFRHSVRASIQEELQHVLELSEAGDQYLIDRYAGEAMQQQIDEYLSDPAFVDDSLFECGAFIYSAGAVQNPDQNLFREWFYHNCLWSVQDQLSLPYLIQQFNLKIGILKGTVYQNPYLNLMQNPE